MCVCVVCIYLCLSLSCSLYMYTYIAKETWHWKYSFLKSLLEKEPYSFWKDSFYVVKRRLLIFVPKDFFFFKNRLDILGSLLIQLRVVHIHKSSSSDTWLRAEFSQMRVKNDLMVRVCVCVCVCVSVSVFVYVCVFTKMCVSMRVSTVCASMCVCFYFGVSLCTSLFVCVSMSLRVHHGVSMRLCFFVNICMSPSAHTHKHTHTQNKLIALWPDLHSCTYTYIQKKIQKEAFWIFFQ